MKKNNKLLRIIQWFFEEDVSEESVSNDDTIEIGLIQIVLIILITAIFSVWIFFEPIKGFFNRPQLSTSEYIEKHIEKNYFIIKNPLKNSDFSQGLEHWASSDCGLLFPDSKSVASIDKHDYHSAPSSLKIKCISPANRYHYSKNEKNKVLDNPYSFKQTECWMGILPGREINASIWYKGDIVKFTINYINKSGEWNNLDSVFGSVTNQWSQLKINKKVPLDARAIMIEITVNKAENSPLPVVWIDDINLKTANFEEK